MTGEQEARAFALIGDRYHNSDYIRTALTRTLVESIGLAVDFSDDIGLLNEQHLAQYSMLITFRDGMIWPDGYGPGAPYPGYDGRALRSEPEFEQQPSRMVYWMSPQQGRAVHQFVHSGGAALLYHNSTYIAASNDDFRRVLGAATEGHPPVRPYRVEIVNEDHPITRDVRSFVVTDEQHYMVYDADPDHVLAYSVNEQGDTYKELGARCQAVWAYDYGEGRVCYMSPGHTIEALWNAEYVKMQQNAARWVLRQC